ncbi:hypothetical protein GGS24DRAFT_454892 [Hypoxylon argillaceum]|nr:hypothetical protein GGS24DRAFT_454892 [Hypoxylon argillaceum]KAI1149803.1 hypothetical protein F4825DRAFT_429113 [Nemania diffusa]
MSPSPILNTRDYLHRQHHTRVSRINHRSSTPLLVARMESLRNQLAETVGALTERDKKFRELRADHLKDKKLWAEARTELEKKLKHLELENLRLEAVTKSLPSPLAQKSKENLLKWEDLGDADGDETVPITRSRMKMAEAQFKKMGELCEALQAELARSSPVPIINLSEDEIKTRWNQLRVLIRNLSLDALSKPFSIDLVSDKHKEEFKMLSPHWKTYANTANITCYLFRALIWRYILRYFEVPCRAAGRDISRKIAEVAEPLSKTLPDVHYQEWSIRTAALIHKVYPIDKSLIEEITTKIAGATTPLAGDVDPIALKNSLRTIVTAAAELSATFDQCRFVVLMYNEPGSTQTHGFPFVPELMDMRVKMASQGMVTLMITPSLLKREATYSIVEKAEVIC